MNCKMELITAVMNVYGDMPVVEFNRMFEGKTEEQKKRLIDLIMAEREQFGGAIYVQR